MEAVQVRYRRGEADQTAPGHRASSREDGRTLHPSSLLTAARKRRLGWPPDRKGPGARQSLRGGERRAQRVGEEAEERVELQPRASRLDCSGAAAAYQEPVLCRWPQFPPHPPPTCTSNERLPLLYLKTRAHSRCPRQTRSAEPRPAPPSRPTARPCGSRGCACSSAAGCAVGRVLVGQVSVGRAEGSSSDRRLVGAAAGSLMHLSLPLQKRPTSSRLSQQHPVAAPHPPPAPAPA